MVEHDTPPEVRETVVEEPHKVEKEKEKDKEEDGEGEDKAEESKRPPSEAEESAYVGVSTFFSGIASMVQTTVSYVFLLMET